ncbi:hypothetical protein [Jannaschia pohangensis]|uniref:Uncharacterized protein n=1 Tax=Jannaschia pohangensis TaxID=390807 RepID=A0A1I3NIH8_9RHOB|nr:hypothetical protein [Jannaschia pohangensis]SFJ09168.1 hypothetical protein SAMN04488095_2168 [Jannaschia pohangensis]
MNVRTIQTLTAAALVALAITPTTLSAQGVFIDAPTSATSTAGLSGLRREIARELPRYGYRDVDVRSLSSGQVAHIYNLLHAGRSGNDTRNLIGGVLRRGLLQRGIDRFTR